MTTPQLPPLPEPARTMWQHGQQIDHYTADQMRAYARATIATQSVWQPIETAPTDGTLIFGYWRGSMDACAMSITWNAAGHWMCLNEQGHEDFFNRSPTHWIPLQPATIKKEQEA